MTTGPTDPTPARASLLRLLVLAVVAFGALGLLAELLLLEHFEGLLQLVPVALLVLTVAGAALVSLRPSGAGLRAFQGLMALLALAGAAGAFFHLRANLEIVREVDPEAAGLGLLWEGLRGGAPALAPGALAQLGLLGLVFTLWHPALARRTSGTQQAPAQRAGSEARAALEEG